MKKAAPSLARLGFESEENILRRALAAWFRSGAMDTPANDSSVEVHDGHWYAVLRNINGILAVYRVKNDGHLRRLRRPPASIE